MIQKLLGGKKQEYFLEMDNAKGTKSPEPSASSPKIEKEPAEAVEKTEKPAQSTKKTAKKAAKTKKEPKAAPTPPTEPTENTTPVEPQSPEFATKYLLFPTGSRRRPGPSLDKFKSMARDAKVPRS